MHSLPYHFFEFIFIVFIARFLVQRDSVGMWGGGGGGVNSAFFKFFKDRETFEEFSCKTLLNHRDKSQQHTRDLYWFGLLTYSSPQATPLENSLKTLVKLPYKKQGTLANTCPCASLFSTSFARDNLTFHTIQHNL